MRLHVLGLPHTRTTKAFSHCAFTAKVQKFIPMMRAQGFDVFHYGVGDENPGATEHVELVDRVTQEDLLRHDFSDPAKFIGDDANIQHPMYILFNRRLARVLKQTVAKDDIVCLPFGLGHILGTRQHAGINVETGIGYPSAFEPFRIYESNAWAAWHASREKKHGAEYHWVIPNYFEVQDWPLGTGERKYLLYFGRIAKEKGVDVVRAIAQSRPDLDVLLCGQGDPKPWLSPAVPNLKYVGTRAGLERAPLVGGAIALLAPTRFIEPFCGVTVEANLCGTPALTAPYGVFPETIENGGNGWRCHTLGDYLAAIEWAERLGLGERAMIREAAVQQYSLEAIGPRYAHVFEYIADVRRARGWYTLRSSVGPITKAREIAS
jgi:glycosyltransferase involved in cell wall biosynthesis